MFWGPTLPTNFESCFILGLWSKICFALTLILLKYCGDDSHTLEGNIHPEVLVVLPPDSWDSVPPSIFFNLQPNWAIAVSNVICSTTARVVACFFPKSKVDHKSDECPQRKRLAQNVKTFNRTYNNWRLRKLEERNALLVRPFLRFRGCLGTIAQVK